MTVKELIDKLNTLPSDVQVIYPYHSDWAVLDEDEVKLVKHDENPIYERIMLRGDRYINWHSAWSMTELGDGHFVDVVTIG